MSDQLIFGTIVTDESDNIATIIAQKIAGRNPTTFRQIVFDDKMRNVVYLVVGG
jgi:hypothetical protein